MTNTNNVKRSLYLIRIKEKISPQIADWFEGANIITNDQGETMITCSIIDQAALHGILSKIRDLNLTLISLSKVELPQNIDQINQDVSP
jgi:hypothetical protein